MNKFLLIVLYISCISCGEQKDYRCKRYAIHVLNENNEIVGRIENVTMYYPESNSKWITVKTLRRNYHINGKYRIKEVINN